MVGKVGIQNQLSAKYYGLVGLAAYKALEAGGAPPAALAGKVISTVFAGLTLEFYLYHPTGSSWAQPSMQAAGWVESWHLMDACLSTLCCLCPAAFAGHSIVSNLAPWNQGKYDTIIAKQLQGVSAADVKKASDIAVPIAVKLFRER